MKIVDQPHSNVDLKIAVLQSLSSCRKIRSNPIGHFGECLDHKSGFCFFFGHSDVFTLLNNA